MFATRIPAHAFFSHSTAALLYAVPLPWALENSTLVHVGVQFPAARLHSRGLVGHQLELAPDALAVRHGLAVTSPARTWCDLATQLDLADLVAAGDFLIHHRLPHTDRRALTAAVDTMPGKRGVRLAREALSLLSEFSESRPESQLRVIIVRGGLPEPEINYTLLDSTTGVQVRPDFLFRRQKVILEYQGDYHRTKSQWRKDMTRRSRLETQGWRVMELNADDLRDPAELVSRVQLALISR